MPTWYKQTMTEKRVTELRNSTGTGYEHLYIRALREIVVHFFRQTTSAFRVGEWFQPFRLPSPVRSVLFVCKANICRSPLAAVYFRSLVEKCNGHVLVRSAGLDTMPGRPAHPTSRAIARARQLSLDTHTTTQVHAELLGQSDLIVVMEVGQKDRIHKLYPKSKGKVLLLGSFDQQGTLEIVDPFNGTREDFDACFQRITRCCDVLVAKLELEIGSQRENDSLVGK